MRRIACLLLFIGVCTMSSSENGTIGPLFAPGPAKPTGPAKPIGPIAAASPADEVDPLIGTDKSVRPTMWESNGATFPGVLAPHGMVQITPDGYHYTDTKIRGFSYLDHGSGWGSTGRFIVLPFVGATATSSAFSHQREIAHPWQYDVELDDYHIQASFAATLHAGFARFRFPSTKDAHILLSDVSGVVVIGDTGLTGRCGGTWFTARTSKRFRIGHNDSTGVRLDFEDADIVDLRTGFSVTGAAAAATNLLAEMPDYNFETYSTGGREVWNKTLGRIEIKGGDEAHRKVFYTALYHSFFMPAILSDAGVSPRRYTPTYPWDTYRSEHPLNTLLDPIAEGEMIASTLCEYDKTGWLPTGNMLGNHNVELILDAYVKGIRNFDIDKARAAIRKSLMTAPYARRDMGLFNTLGYVPAAHVNSVSETLEFAYNDWAGAMFLRATDPRDSAAADTLLARSFAYAQVYDPETGFMRAKTDSGTFTDGGYCEGTPWTYSWFVPHDILGLVDLMGGVKHFALRLTECFDKGFYIHDNEPPLHMAYLFDFVGEPWKTQQYARAITERSYTAVPGGLPGNDDLGALSSWYVLSAMGFYPVTVGVPLYEIGSPVFEECILHLPNGKTFTIRAHGSSATNKYVHTATLDGTPYQRPWIAHADILAGGTLSLEMSPTPNKNWGAETKDAPPSVTAGHPIFTLGMPAITTANTPAGVSVQWTCRISNDGPATGSIQLELYVDGKPYSTRNTIIAAGDTTRVSIPITLYQAGIHTITLGQTGFPQKLTVNAKPATFVFSDLTIPMPPVVTDTGCFFVGVQIKNTGSSVGTTNAVLSIDGRTADTRPVTIAPGEKKPVLFAISAKDCPPMAIIGINEMTPVTVRVLRASLDYNTDWLHGLGAVAALTFDEGPGNQIPDHSGADNYGIVHGTPHWVSGLFGKAIHLDAAHGSYIELKASRSLDTLVHNDSMTLMAWVYPMDEENFADILCRGDWHTLQLKASNTVVNFYTAGWEGHEAFAPVPALWNRHWHHIAGVTHYPFESLYIDGRLVAVKRMEPRDPNGETGLTDYSNHPWSIGRNDGDPTRLFKGYIDDVMIFNKALSPETINRVMMHAP